MTPRELYLMLTLVGRNELIKDPQIQAQIAAFAGFLQFASLPEQRDFYIEMSVALEGLEEEMPVMKEKIESRLRELTNGNSA